VALLVVVSNSTDTLALDRMGNGFMWLCYASCDEPQQLSFKFESKLKVGYFELNGFLNLFERSHRPS
jgi:hypothetical protein